MRVLYFSSGGGFIGVEHESVKRFAKEFVASAAKFLPLMKPAESLALPDAQMVAFYALTPGGVLKAEDAKRGRSRPEEIRIRRPCFMPGKM